MELCGVSWTRLPPLAEAIAFHVSYGNYNMEKVEFKFDVDWRENLFFCGLDVHKHKLDATISSAEYRTAKTVSRSLFRVDNDGLMRFWNYVKKYRPAAFAMEATGIYHHLIYKFLKKKIDAEPWNSELVITNPSDSNNLPGRQKNDKVDSESLARYLALGMLKKGKPLVDVLEDIKVIFRRMHRIEKERTILKNRIKKNLDRAGIRPKGLNLNLDWVRYFLFHFMRFYGTLGAFLEEIKQDQDHPLAVHRTMILKNRGKFEPYSGFSLSTFQRILIRQDLVELDFKTARKTIFTIEIGRIIEQYPTLRENASNLATIPGISKFSAVWLLGEIGTIRQYPTSRKFSAYCGCCPRVISSAGKVYSAHVTRHSNKYVRTIFYNAAVVICNFLKQDCDLKRYATRTVQRKGKLAFKLAICTISTKLSKIAYAILRDGVPYNPSHRHSSSCSRKNQKDRPFALVDKRLIRKARKSLLRVNEVERKETLGILRREIEILAKNLDDLLQGKKIK